MKPFMRPLDRGRLSPVGWVAEPAGLWAGREVEVVYDPRRHQVVVLRNDPGDPTRAAIAGNSYRRVAVAGQQEMWVRDRVAATQNRLDRLEHGHSHGRVVDISAYRSPGSTVARR